MEDKIKELTLLLLYLTSWEEKDVKMRRSWKGYPFDIMNELMDEEKITGSYRAKSVYLTESGVEEAEKLMKKYWG